MSKIWFRTETGSLYEIDYEKKHWARVEEPSTTGLFPLRTIEGGFDKISDLIVGLSMTWTGAPLNKKEGYERRVETSRVVEIYESWPPPSNN